MYLKSAAFLKKILSSFFCCLPSCFFYSGIPNDVSFQNKGTWYVTFASYTCACVRAHTFFTWFILVNICHYVAPYKCLSYH